MQVGGLSGFETLGLKVQVIHERDAGEFEHTAPNSGSPVNPMGGRALRRYTGYHNSLLLSHNSLMIFVDDITQSLGGHNPLMVSVGKHVDREDEQCCTGELVVRRTDGVR